MWWTIVFLLFCSGKFARSSRSEKGGRSEKKLADHPMPRSLAESKLSELVQRTDYPMFYDEIVKKVLRVRVPGTKGHHAVKLFIKNQFEHLNWTVTLDEFDSPTPLGYKRFTNIIATLNPNAKKRLVLAAHYDSKLKPSKEVQQQDGSQKTMYFLGAIDSAVPCAMLIEIAKIVTPLFAAAERNQATRDGLDESDVTLQMVFFDGEEAFEQWSKNDSLYGARHLAQEWANTPHPLGSTNSTMIDTITAFVLLDLIGAPKPRFCNIFMETNDLFERLQLIERRLMSTNDIENHWEPYFVPGLMDRRFFVEDDHIPFLERNVKVLHLIPLPFPPCWHDYCDDETSLDHTVINHLLKIFQVFVVQYFGLTVS